MKLKDEALAHAALQANVAQFASFSPTLLELRHSAICGFDGSKDPHHIISQLLGQSSVRKVNVRSFKPGVDRGNPFVMGLEKVDDVLNVLRRLADDGYYTIVNEHIDPDDGGVSGVRWNGWTEFAPKDTPRCVEKPGTAGLPADKADKLFEMVYRTATPLQGLDPGYRVEFSIHPSTVGYRRERNLVWEVSEEVSTQDLPGRLVEWPNRFSEFIGDKAYGLIIADLHGFRVPRTNVIARDVAPFSFGTHTKYGMTWTRTCPRQFAPGKYPTEPRYVDVFKMLTECDPDGDLIASVLVQEGVGPQFSGAVTFVTGREALVSGVRGIGSDYMLGVAPDEELPRSIKLEALNLFDSLVRCLGGPCRFEWVRDNESMWLVQLNRDFSHGFNVSEGSAASWVTFDPAEGIDALEKLIAQIRDKSVGVKLTKRVGLTSHIGDLLRVAEVPARVPGYR